MEILKRSKDEDRYYSPKVLEDILIYFVLYLFGIILYPNYAFVVCLQHVNYLVKMGTISSFPTVLGYISDKLNYHNKSWKNKVAEQDGYQCSVMVQR